MPYKVGGTKIPVKMAASGGYEYNFLHSVPEDFYCKICSLVAKRLSVISCCGESFCHDCISNIQQDDNPCPECGKQGFTFLELLKHQKRICSLELYCSLKNEGCDWIGPLEQLETHLDPYHGTCQYVDIQCPLNCQEIIPKHKINEHLIKKCVKRDYFCQYCNFKATYEEVMDIHLPECPYVPLTCPNRCGVTCEREMMEDHKKICRLEELACEFMDMGCEDKFVRDLERRHKEENADKHLCLVAKNVVKNDVEMKRLVHSLTKVMLERESRLHVQLEEKEKIIVQLETLLKDVQNNQISIEEDLETYKQNALLVTRITDQICLNQQEEIRSLEEQMILRESKIHQQLEKKDDRIRQLEETAQEQSKQLTKLQENISKIEDLEKKMEELSKVLTENDGEVNEMRNSIKKTEEQCTATSDYLQEVNQSLTRSFYLVLPSAGLWTSPCMYTHTHGYKFSVCLWNNSQGEIRWYLNVTEGKYDEELTWPVAIKCTVDLTDRETQEDFSSTHVFNVNKLEESRASSLKTVLLFRTAKLSRNISNRNVHILVHAFIS